MPISTPMMIGAAFLVLVVIIIIAVVATSGNNVEGEVVIDDTIPDEITPVIEENKPDCSEFVCEDNYDNKLGNGDTSDECCEKKLCTELSTPPSCVSPKVIDQFSRGNTADECCKVPYCDSNLCGNGRTLKGDNIRGVTEDECCRDLPTCDSFRCPLGEEKKANPESIYGETSEVCCNQKTCQENLWDTKCLGPLAPGMTWQDTSALIPGNTKEECCTQGSCYDNGWTGDSGTTKCESAFLGGSVGNSPIMDDMVEGGDLGIIYGNTVSECCIMKKCSEQDDPWDSEKCEASSSQEKKLKNNGDETGNTEDICCESKKCSDWTTSGAGCPPGKKDLPGETIGNDEDKCCSLQTCSEKYGASNPCDETGNYSPNALVGDDPHADAGQNQFCCTTKKCNDASEGLNTVVKCNGAPAITGDALINGVSLYGVGSDISETNLSWTNCCEPTAKCKDAYPDDTKCPSGQQTDPDNQETIIDGNQSGTMTEDSANTLCCKSKICKDMEFTCPDQWEKDGEKENNEYINPGDGADPEKTNVCCSLKKCADNGWTDAKCKDREFTAAKNRGKLKSDDPRGYGPEHVKTADGQKYNDTGVVGNTPAHKRSDEHCCEQDLKNNFARTCIHNEINKDNGIHRKSTGAIALWHRVAGDGILDRTNLDADKCKVLCDANTRCNSFWLDVNGRCITLPGFNSPESTVRSSGSPDPNDPTNPAAKKIDWEYFAPIEGGGHTYSQYYNGGAFPEDKRYSGGKHDGQKDFGKREGCVGELDGAENSGTDSNCKKSSGGSPTLPKDSPDANDWDKRKEILLAGVDEEFCPFHWIHSYGHTSNRYAKDNGRNGAGNSGGWALARPNAAVSNAATNLGDPGGGGDFARTEKKEYNWTGSCPEGYRLGDHYDGCWDDPNCRKFMTHVGGSHTDAATQTRFLQPANDQQTFMTRPEHRRACVNHHVGSDTTTVNDTRTGHTLIKSIHIDHQETNDSKKYIHGVLPPKAAVAANNSNPSWGPVPSKMLISGDTGTGDASV